MKVRENDKPSAQHSRFLKMFKQLRLEIGLKDALVEMPKFNKWLSSLLRNKEKLEEIAITTLNRTSALADSGASINLLPYSIYKKLGLEALTPTRKEELVYYADKSKKNKDKHFVHAVSIIDFSKDDPFSGSTTNTLPPSSSLMKTSDNFEKFADELAPLDSLPPENDKDVEIKSSSSFTLTSPEESDLKYLEKDSIQQELILG
ncbi:reverse transcriptase domain-containing protein [Tanacetum coccineum]